MSIDDYLRIDAGFAKITVDIITHATERSHEDLNRNMFYPRLKADSDFLCRAQNFCYNASRGIRDDNTDETADYLIDSAISKIEAIGQDKSLNNYFRDLLISTFTAGFTIASGANMMFNLAHGNYKKLAMNFIFAYGGGIVTFLTFTSASQKRQESLNDPLYVLSSFIPDIKKDKPRAIEVLYTNYHQLKNTLDNLSTKTY